MSQHINILSNPLFFKTYLHLGNHKCFTNPKVHTHLLGTRYIHEVFSITKLRIQIMQLYPMIQQMIVHVEKLRNNIANAIKKEAA